MRANGVTPLQMRSIRSSADSVGRFQSGYDRAQSPSLLIQPIQATITWTCPTRPNQRNRMHMQLFHFRERALPYLRAKQNSNLRYPFYSNRTSGQAGLGSRPAERDGPHLAAVLKLTLNSAAAVLIGMRSWITLRANSSRRMGVSRAFLWMCIAKIRR